MKLSISRFDQVPVLVVGDAMLDRYWHGAVSRISPEAPVPVVRVEQREDRPGGAANIALNTAAPGVQALLVGVTSRGEIVDSLASSPKAVEVDTRFQRIDNQSTIVKLRVMSRHQQLLRVDFEEPFRTDTMALAVDVGLLLTKAKVLVLSDYGKDALQNHQVLIQVTRARNTPVLADPKGKDLVIYRGTSLVTLNLSEFETIVGRCTDGAELVVKGQALMSEPDPGALLVTRGEHGMTLLHHGQPALYLPARAREVFGVTGAGDTVISTLAAALTAGKELSSAVGLANLAAGIVVGKLGIAATSASEPHRAVQRKQGSECGVLGLEQLLLTIEDAHAHGEKIVFTSGCFDILHTGHVTYLEQAHVQGDRLIVGANDDVSVIRLKSVGRPINSVDWRMAVLAGLGAADWVVSSAENTPERLFEQVRSDVLVKGGDYGVEQVVGAQIVEVYGGEVRVLGLVGNSSTTAIVEKICQKDQASSQPVTPGE